MDELLIMKRAEDTGSDVVVSSAQKIIKRLKEYETGEFNCFPYSNNSIILEWIKGNKRAGIIIGQNDLDTGWYYLTTGEPFDNQP